MFPAIIGLHSTPFFENILTSLSLYLAVLQITGKENGEKKPILSKLNLIKFLLRE